MLDDKHMQTMFKTTEEHISYLSDELENAKHSKGSVNLKESVAVTSLYMQLQQALITYAIYKLMKEVIHGKE